MEETGSSCCSPQRPDNVSTVIAPEFFPEANLTKANFVTIPAGEFLMGTDEPFYPTDGEGPSRSVWLDEFKISQYSVTNSEFAAFTEATGYQTEAEIYGWSYVFNGFIDETTAENNSKGIRSHDVDGVLEIVTLGISRSSNPAAGINVFSSPLFVPKKMHLSEGLVFIHCRATASAGSMCPAVPPPARTTVAI